MPHTHRRQFVISNSIRKLAALMLFDRMGKNPDIGRGIRFSKSVSIGNDSSIGDHAYISGELLIGDSVMIAPHCSFIAMNHIFDENDPLRHLGSKREKIVICDHSWIGFGCIILAGVKVGEGAIVAAGAVVSNDVPPYSVVGGVPARVIKYRKE